MTVNYTKITMETHFTSLVLVPVMQVNADGVIMRFDSDVFLPRNDEPPSSALSLVPLCTLQAQVFIEQFRGLRIWILVFRRLLTECSVSLLSDLQLSEITRLSHEISIVW